MASVPDVRRRVAASATIVSTAVSVVLMAVGVGAEVGRLLAGSVLLVLATIAASYTVTRAGWRRAVGLVAFVTVLVLLAIITLLGERTNGAATSRASLCSSPRRSSDGGRSAATFER